MTGPEAVIINNELTDKQGSGYMPQLDSLRALAVFLVLLEHYLPTGHPLRILPLGMYGVYIFFVLSGFLITQILLKSKMRIDDHSTGMFHSLKQFYARRTLRIFPIYYITILIAFLFNFESIREKILWYIFYVSNIYFYISQSWDGALSHLWTLSVEEQFYLFWPLLIFLIARRYLYGSIVFLIIFGVTFRTVLFQFSDQTGSALDYISILTPSCLDAFGLGAVLAYIRCYKNSVFNFFDNPIKALILLSANVLTMTVLTFFEENIISVALYKFNFAVIAMMLVSGMSAGFKGPLKKIFENKLLMYLGKISYGIYLFHNFIPHMYTYAGLPYIDNLFMRFLTYVIILIIISSVSWYLIEKPINGLKKYFKYS